MLMPIDRDVILEQCCFTILKFWRLISKFKPKFLVLIKKIILAKTSFDYPTKNSQVAENYHEHNMLRSYRIS